MFRSISHIFTPIFLAIAAAICTYSQATPNCPTITVSGPAGIPRPGEGFHFSATIEGKVPNDVSYKWTVSEGTIVRGQGTDKIKVDADWETSGISLTATVEVFGLPKECPNTSFETASVSVDYFDPILVDEYTTQPSRIDEARLSKFASEMSKYPNNFAYVYEYFRPGTRTTTIERKNSLTKAALVRAGLPADNFKIEVVTNAEQNRTRLYRVPPGRNNPTP